MSSPPPTTLDSDAFISLPVSERLFRAQPNPSEIYVRANVNDVKQVSSLLAAPAAGFVIGAIAGLYPAAKAARLSPTEALRSR